MSMACRRHPWPCELQINAVLPLFSLQFAFWFFLHCLAVQFMYVHHDLSSGIKELMLPKYLQTYQPMCATVKCDARRNFLVMQQGVTAYPTRPCRLCVMPGEQCLLCRKWSLLTQRGSVGGMCCLESHGGYVCRLASSHCLCLYFVLGLSLSIFSFRIGLTLSEFYFGVSFTLATPCFGWVLKPRNSTLPDVFALYLCQCSLTGVYEFPCC